MLIIKEKCPMDRRLRRYYLVRFDHPNYELAISLVGLLCHSKKISSALPHMKAYSKNCCVTWYYQMLISCRKEDCITLESIIEAYGEGIEI